MIGKQVDYTAHGIRVPMGFMLDGDFVKTNHIRHALKH